MKYNFIIIAMYRACMAKLSPFDGLRISTVHQGYILYFNVRTLESMGNVTFIRIYDDGHQSEIFLKYCLRFRKLVQLHRLFKLYMQLMHCNYSCGVACNDTATEWLTKAFNKCISI